jgi:hypothetical protein
MRTEVLLHRAAGQHLGTRTDALSAIRAIGLRDVQGWGVVSLHARATGVTIDSLDAARAAGEIADVVGPRGAGLTVPSADIDVFTLGSLPADEGSLRTRLRNLLPLLDASGLTATAALAAACEIASETLAAGPVDIGTLSGALTRGLPALSPMCPGRCTVAHISQSLFDLVGASGVWVHDDRGDQRLYVSYSPSMAREDARAELALRFARCHGPAPTADRFAQWCGISRKDAAASVVEVEPLTTPAAGVRLVPPRDPYLLDRDRAVLVPDEDARRRIFRPTQTDGVALVDGAPVASWRARKGSRSTYEVRIDTFAPLVLDDALQAECDAVAALRRCDRAEVTLS